MKNTINKRESNFELLRIISMFMIIFLHFCTFNSILKNIPEFSFKYFIFNGLFYLCLASVNLYVFITGYFTIESKFKISKLIKLELEVLFYSIGIYFLVVVFGLEKFNYKHFFTDLFPTIFAKYWFITGYVFLYLLSPLINKFVKSLSKKQFDYTIILLFIVFVLIGTINPINRTLSLSSGYSLIWMIYLYFVGAYIKLHYNKNDSKLKLIIIIIGCVAVKLLLDNFLMNYTHINAIKGIIDNKYTYNNLFIFIESVCIFLLFRNIRIKSNFVSKIIIFISSSTLAVYLIHMNYDIYLKMWKYINPIQYILNNKIYLCLLLSLFVIFFGCVLIDKIRFLIFSLIYKIPFIKKIFEKVDKFDIFNKKE